MPVHASRAGHIDPWNFRILLFHCGGQAPGGFGDNFERSRYGVKDKEIVAEAFVVETVNEALSQNDVIADVKKDKLSNPTT